MNLTEQALSYEMIQENKKVWSTLLLDFPVAINNFYGDPLIQWENTCKRLNILVEQKHIGPVGIITKSKITDNRINDLVDFRNKGLNIVVLCSISELVDFEKAPHDYRYENIRKLNTAGIPNIAYIRPMVPPYNTSPGTIDHIISNLAKVHADAVCLSGFRGDDELVNDMSPDDKLEWTMRVKLLSKDVYERFKVGAEANNMHLFLRTACAVAYVLGLKSPFNPYYNSPNLCKCSELNCPLLSTCKRSTDVKDGSLEFLSFLGFDVEIQYKDGNELCYVEGDNRLGCLSCCTTCYNLKVPRLYVKNKDINLGTLTFIRFLTGMLTVQDNVRDFGDKDIGFVKLPNFPEIDDFVCLNTWAAYSQHGNKCFDCTYCIEKYYKGRDCNTTPLDLLNRIEKLLILEL